MIQVREARLEDLEAIVSLLIELQEVTTLHGPIEPASVKNSYESMLGSREIYRIFLAVEGQEVIGLVSVVLYKTLLHPGGTGLINELVVTEAARGRGIGRRLVQSVLVVAGELGMDEVEVGTEIGNLSARRFYAAAGFDQEYLLLGMEL